MEINMLKKLLCFLSILLFVSQETQAMSVRSQNETLSKIRNALAQTNNKRMLGCAGLIAGCFIVGKIGFQKIRSLMEKRRIDSLPVPPKIEYVALYQYQDPNLDNIPVVLDVTNNTDKTLKIAVYGQALMLLPGQVGQLNGRLGGINISLNSTRFCKFENFQISQIIRSEENQMGKIEITYTLNENKYVTQASLNGPNQIEREAVRTVHYMNSVSSNPHFIKGTRLVNADTSLPGKVDGLPAKVEEKYHLKATLQGDYLERSTLELRQEKDYSYQKGDQLALSIAKMANAH